MNGKSNLPTKQVAQKQNSARMVLGTSKIASKSRKTVETVMPPEKSVPQCCENRDGARNWTAVGALFALGVGLLSAALSAYSSYIQTAQTRAQVWTQLFVSESDTRQAWIIQNKGVGPARIKSMRIYVDGKSYRHWSSLSEPDHRPGVLDALGIRFAQREQRNIGLSSVAGNTVAANESIEAIKFSYQDEWKSFQGKLSHLKERICYCSTLDECHVWDGSIDELTSRSKDVSFCERLSEDEFYD